MSPQPPAPKALAVPSGRLARFSRLGSMTAGVAGNMALNGMGELTRGKRPSLRGLLMTPQNITRIADQLAQMRGAAMKVGQLVSMDTGDMLPPELADIMARLRADAHFMPPAQLKQVFNTHWPQDWLREFKHFDVRPIAAASIGQVHRATLHDGREVAVKVQYPGVAKSIDSDVANVGALIRMSGLLPKGFELAPYLEEARKQLHDETDYQLEARFMTEFSTLLQDDARYIVPQVCDDWTTAGILAMTFQQGQPIERTKTAPQDVRDRVITSLIELTLRELFDFQLMQTDPNFANYLYEKETDRIVLLDFGATRRISPQISDQYRRLLQSGMRSDWIEMRNISEEIGFFSPDTPERYSAQILAMMQMVFEALNADGLTDFATTPLPKQMQDKGMALAQDGFIPPPLPIDVLFIQRKFGGVFLLASQLAARVDLRGLLARYL